MSDPPTPEVPPDVHETLTGLLASAVEYARAGDAEGVRDCLDTVTTVATYKLPPSQLRSRLRHGCQRVGDTVEADYAVAAEYIRAMQRRLEGVAEESRLPEPADERSDDDLDSD
ncbi:MAG: hypothetical protein ABEJ79_01680 [Halolamina sp.]